MSAYNDNRRNTARWGGSGKGTSLRDLHQVSPEMRERYGVTGTQQTRSNRPRQTQDAGDWRTPSVDPIGGRSLNGRSSRGSRGGNGNRGNGGGLLPGGFNLPILIALLVVLVLLVAVIVLATSRCSEGSASAPTEGTQTEQSSSTADSSSASGSASGSAAADSASTAESAATDAGIDRSKLVSILDQEIADKLINRASTSESAKWIAQNPDKYAMDGNAVQRKLLKLAADEPAAQTYVRNFPDKYPMSQPANGKVSTVTTGKNVPRFYQWDELWGYTTYSGTAFGLTGCGPTCMAMVYQAVTGSTDLWPYDMGEIAVRDGYADDYEGTYANFFTEEASTLGLPVVELDITEKALKNAIQSGQVVVANFAPGLFTEYGHYVVISGQRQDGTLIMNDPYSEERSNKSWDISTIVEESQGLYAYG